MEKLEFRVKDRGVTMYLPEGGDSRSAVYMPCVPGEADDIAALLGGWGAALVVPETDWNRDLSPWAAPRAFRNGEDFSGCAPEFLKALCGDIIPESERRMGAEPVERAVAGYSLAGLFSLWALYNTDVFDCAASVSGSLWFDGFVDYMKRQRPARIPERVYFSLGDRESSARNTRLASVGSCIAEARDAVAELGAETVLEYNSGGHFADAALRTARGVQWLLRR